MAFSAMEVLSSRSSIVAIKVATVPSKSMLVTTRASLRFVLTFKPGGVLKLSGATASATDLAVFGSLYSSVIVAFNVFSLQLLAN